jgi:hypothetical protein
MQKRQELWSPGIVLATLRNVDNAWKQQTLHLRRSGARKGWPTLLTLTSITRFIGAGIESVDVKSAVAKAWPVGCSATCAVHI